MICGRMEEMNPILPEQLAAALSGYSADSPIGKTVLIEGKLWISVFDVAPGPAAGKLWEAHRDFADLQMVLSGGEYCLLDESSQCIAAGEYDAQSDCRFFTHPGAECTAVRLIPGVALLIGVGEVHAPGVICGDGAPYRKLVAKIHRELLPAGPGAAGR